MVIPIKVLYSLQRFYTNPVQIGVLGANCDKILNLYGEKCCLQVYT